MHTSIGILLAERLRARLRNPELVADIRYPPYKPVPLPVSAQQLQAAEEQLGFPLPPLLRELYLHVGNGGFGPGYGLIGLRGGPMIYGLNLVEFYLEGVNALPPEPYQPWPNQFIQICDWGDSITSALNRIDADSPVLRVHGDRYDGGPWEAVMALEAPSLHAWLEDWLSDKPLSQRASL